MAGVENINSSVANAATLSPPWTQIVRGPESDSTVAPSSPPAGGETQSSAVESSDDNAGNKKPAWSKKPSSESGPVVMGADLWPALSELSTKASPKLSPSNSALSLSDLGSITSPQKPTTSKANHSVTPSPNHGQPSRQKSMKRDGGGNAQANGGFSHQNSLPREGSHSHNVSLKTSSGGSSENSGRELGTRNPNGDHHHPRSSFRRGNGGTHARGDGSHQNYGGRRNDQDRGNHDWSHQRSFNGRDAPLQPRVGPRGYVRPPPVSAPFVHPGGPAPMRPFMNPMVMPDMSMIYFSQGVPIVAPVPPPMYFPVPDPQLQAKIVNQIDYYFSNENLIKDTFLRNNMDKDGWVPIALVASFKKVMQLTDNIQLILDVVRSNSSVVEVKADKIRKRDDYMKWIMPPSVEFSPGSATQSPRSPNITGLSAHFHSVTLDQNAPNAASMLRSSSGDLNSSSSVISVGATPGRC